MTPARPAPPANALPRVLVAEDNKLNGLLIAEQLHVLAFSPEVVTNGLIALQRWRGEEFAAVLTDINMPGMDGYELATAIRTEERAGMRIPIIALTANAFIDKSGRWQAAGIDHLLTKPLELSVLKATLDRWLLQRDPAPDGTAQRPMAAGNEPIDAGALARVVGDNPAVLAQFMAKFSRSAVQAAAHLEAAMAGPHDRLDIGKVAHQLKASAGAVGAGRLAQLCEGIESAALAADDQALASAWRQFPAEIGRVVDWIKARALADAAAPGAVSP
jgi:two-component system sensor histidine kinase/response regulator